MGHGGAPSVPTFYISWHCLLVGTTFCSFASVSKILLRHGFEIP